VDGQRTQGMSHLSPIEQDQPLILNKGTLSREIFVNEADWISDYQVHLLFFEKVAFEHFIQLFFGWPLKKLPNIIILQGPDGAKKIQDWVKLSIV
jgi:hypothetical protein